MNIKTLQKFISNFRLTLRSPKWRWALIIAVASDIAGSLFVFAPPVHWVIDIVTGFLLLVTLGFRWPLLVALVVEVIPAIQIFPFWTLFVMAMAGTEDKNLKSLS